MDHSKSDQSTVLNRYFSEIRGYPVLNKQAEQRLARKVRQGCKESRDALIESNLSFVVKVATEYRNLGLPFEDLLNEGNLGLIEAANRYDETKGTKFITYAIWWIRKSILKALSERSSLIRVPYYQMQKVREYRQTEEELRRTLGRKPEREEVSLELSRSLGRVDRSLQYNLKTVDLDQKIGGDSERSISELLEDSSSLNAENDLLEREARGLIAKAMEVLSEQEQAVVRMRFGLSGKPAMTLRAVGKIMDISRERVRQIECKAKSRMQKFFTSVGSPTPPKPNR